MTVSDFLRFSGLGLSAGLVIGLTCRYMLFAIRSVTRFARMSVNLN